jgi:hypothetical protein
LAQKYGKLFYDERTCGEYINLSTLPFTPNKLLFKEETQIKMKIKVIDF